MRAVLQRVSYASVEVDGQITGKIGQGLLALVGFQPDDQEKDYQYMTDKMIHLRIFEDAEGKMNRSVDDIGGSILVVPNFTLYGDARHGRRPGFSDSSAPEIAHGQFDAFYERLRRAFPSIQAGIFQAEMKVAMLNDGPVTILLDSDRKF